MNQLIGFDHICVISLWNRPEKRQYISNLFKKNNINNYFIDNAYDGTLVPGQFNISSGEIGRTVSHLVAISEYANSDKDDILFIVEDDISFDNLPNTTIKDLTYNFDKDILRLSSTSTVAYAITKAGARLVSDTYFPPDKRLLVNFNDIQRAEQVIFDPFNTSTVDFFSKNPNLPSDIKNVLDKK